ncbi:MAG: 50S ribosomal protein L15 [Gemmatimonadaceae bacterium]|nr:50S ribosomal protein L15 [Gloeobacterales cyanobacterium ES-bin-141]
MKALRLEDCVPQKGARHRKKRLGRGHSAGQGKTSGRGMRGQNCRSGGGVRPGFEGGQIPLYRRIPKLKGFQLINQRSFTIVNLRQLNELPEGTTVTLESLLQAGILTSRSGGLRVLGDGELTRPLSITAEYFTAGARTKIEAAGGTCILEK